ncbi:MAG: ATPase, T2SS/T4P/T4SS family [Actinomycetota bacterium]|nr:ATPase, T2SS/T4P/T4SS family [Actinomycetota bacterium]
MSDVAVPSATEPVAATPGTGPSAATVDAIVEAIWSSVGPSLRSLAEDEVRAHVRTEAPPLVAEDDLDAATHRLLGRADGLGLVMAHFHDEAVTDVLVNGNGGIWIEGPAGLRREGGPLDQVALARLTEQLRAHGHVRLDRAEPLADLTLGDEFRVNVVLPPVAVDGPCVALRRVGGRRRSLADLCPAPVASELAEAVRRRDDIVVSGGTGAGKTTLLGALAGAVGPTERIVTIEDTPELALAHDHVVRLRSREANGDGAGAIDIRRLVRNALRMRPDRIIVGEVRGPEVLDMLWAMNTGHAGSLSTVHANSPRDALRRLESLALLAGSRLPVDSIRDQLRSAVDLVVQVERRDDGTRAVTSVVRVGPDADWTSGDGLEPVPVAASSSDGP